MKRLGRVAVTVAATLAGVALLWQFRAALILFMLSLALAATLRPVVERQVALGLPRRLALILSYGLSLAFFVGLVWLATGPLLDNIAQLTDQFAKTYDNIWAHWPAGTAFQQAVLHWLPPPKDLYAAITGSSAAALALGLFGLTHSLVDALSQGFIVVVMSLYWGADQAGVERLWLSLLPPHERARAREIWRALESGVGAYIRSELLQSLLAGLLLAISYRIVGLPYPALLAVASALAWLIPWLGAVLALVPVLLVSWTAGAVVTVVASLLTLSVFAVMQFVVEPRLYDRRQDSSLLIALLALILVHAYGLLGLLAAPPLAAAFQILVSRLLAPRLTSALQPTREPFDVLQKRLIALNGRINTGEQPPALQVSNLLRRLEKLAAEAGVELAESNYLPASSHPPGTPPAVLSEPASSPALSPPF